MSLCIDWERFESASLAFFRQPEKRLFNLKCSFDPRFARGVTGYSPRLKALQSSHLEVMMSPYTTPEKPDSAHNEAIRREFEKQAVSFSNPTFTHRLGGAHRMRNEINSSVIRLESILADFTGSI
jgi:hypothetical protein